MSGGVEGGIEGLWPWMDLFHRFLALLTKGMRTEGKWSIASEDKSKHQVAKWSAGDGGQSSPQYAARVGRD